MTRPDGGEEGDGGIAKSSARKRNREVWTSLFQASPQRPYRRWQAKELWI
jgi:hypothetical protein